MTDRIAFELGSLQVRWYGVFVALGFVAGMFIMQWRARKTSYAEKQIPDLTVIAIVGGILGARVLYVITYWQHFRQYPSDIIRIDQGGLVFYGGFFGAALTMILWCRLRKLDAWRIADLVAFGLPLGQAFGRIGCYINGCCFGKVTDSALHVTYYAPPHNMVFERQLEAGHIHAGNISSLAVEGTNLRACLPAMPVQLYQSFINLAILGAIIYLARYVKRPGQLFSCYLMLYTVGRFFNEFNRGDYEVHVWGVFTNAQVVCLFVFPVAVALFFYRRHAADPTGDAAKA